MAEEQTQESQDQGGNEEAEAQTAGSEVGGGTGEPEPSANPGASLLGGGNDPEKSSENNDNPDAKEEEGDDKTDKKEESGAPDQYEAFTVPEGQELDEAVLEQYSPVFKELGLSQEQAQKLVDVQAAQVAAQAEQYEQADAARVEAIKQLPDWEQQLALGRKAIEAFAPDQETKDLFYKTPLGNDMRVFKLLAAAGKVVMEGAFVEGRDNNTPAEKDASDVLFGDLPQG